MDIRLDRLLRKRLLRPPQVYSLVLSGSGLVLVPTGDALTARTLAAGDMEHPAVRALIQAEARLAALPPTQLTLEPGAIDVPLPAVLRVAVRWDDDLRPIEMKLDTARGTFTFTLPFTTAARVRALEAALRRQPDG